MRFLGIKLVKLIITLLVVSFLTFMVTSLLPGDPAIEILGAESATPEAIAEVRDDLRLDDPLLVRYGRWLGDAVTGDLGQSYRTAQPVSDAIAERLPVTLQVGGLAVLIALVGAVPLGMYSAFRAGSRTDRIITTGSFGMLALPNFIVAVLLIWVFAVSLGWLPATGWVRLTDDPIGNLRTALLPAMSIALSELAIYARLLRSDMITTLQADSITLARAKGLTTRRILFAHALRPSLFSLMTVAGLQLGAIVSGSVVIETLFGLPGVGRLLVDSIHQRDLLIVQGVALSFGVTFVVANFVVDMLYTVLDPRIRTRGTPA